MHKSVVVGFRSPIQKQQQQLSNCRVNELLNKASVRVVVDAGGLLGDGGLARTGLTRRK